MASADRLIEVFNEAKARPAGAERDRFVAEVCRDEPALKEQVIALLRAHESAGDFLQHPQLASPASLLTEKPGDRIGRYKLLQQIGEGGCGVVYMAEQEEPVRRRVALKVIKLGMETKSVIARFEAERQALALMDHPNIAKVIDAGATDTGRPYFVMELVRGVKITDFCAENSLSTEDRLKLFIQVCQAIQHAHQKGVIHRDIKPSNILVTVNDAVPVPKVIDFGIAKATAGRLTDQTVFTAFEQFIGTPAYMSPEQAVMTSVDIDTRTDIYSLGVLLYELLTGRTPFDQKELLAAGLDEMRRTIREKEPLKPSTRLTQDLVAADVRRLHLKSESRDLESEGVRASSRQLLLMKELIHALRGDLDWIVMKALEKDRVRRYETANGFARDIQRHLSCEPVIARPPSKIYEFQKTVRRHKFGFAAGAALITMLVLGVVASALEALRATRAEREQARQWRIAESRGKKSEEVARLLQDMLKGVGPSVALGRDTALLQEILDKTADRMGKELTDQPEVEVEMGLTLADTYYDLGLFNRMEEVARHSLQLARTRLGEESGSVAKLLILQGTALNRVAQRRLGVLHLSKLEPSEIYSRQHDASLVEAEKYCREGLALSRKLLGAENPPVAYGLYQLASVLEMQYRLTEAEAMYRQALAMYQKLLGGEHPKVATVLHELAVVLAHQDKKLAEAESLIRQALVIQRKLLSSDHPEIANSLEILAIVSFQEGNWPEAETRFREVLEIYRKLQGGTRPEFASVLHNLGYALMVQGKLAEAETMFRQALEMRRKLYGNEHLDVADSLHKLAATIGRQGRLAEMEPLCREEVAIQKKLRAYDCLEVASALNNLGYLLLVQGKLADAETNLVESAVIHRRLTGNAERGLTLNNLAKVFQREGKLAEVETTYRELLAMLQKNAEGGGAEALNDLAWFLATCPNSNLRDGTNAVAYGERAVAATERKNFGCLDTLAAAYAEAGQFVKAISIEKEAFALPHSAGDEPGLTSRIKLYESHTPYRESD